MRRTTTPNENVNEVALMRKEEPSPRSEDTFPRFIISIDANRGCVANARIRTRAVSNAEVYTPPRKVTGPHDRAVRVVAEIGGKRNKCGKLSEALGRKRTFLQKI